MTKNINERQQLTKIQNTNSEENTKNNIMKCRKNGQNKSNVNKRENRVESDSSKRITREIRETQFNIYIYIIAIPSSFYIVSINVENL